MSQGTLGSETKTFITHVQQAAELPVPLFLLPLVFPSGSDSKQSACSVGDLGSIPVSGRSPGEGNGNPLQYSCLEKSTDRGAWWATVHAIAESDMTERLTRTYLLMNISPEAFAF